MNCDKCGAELPENETNCPECGRDNTPPRETNPNPDGMSVRAQTVPQRPRTSYSDRRTERKPSQKNRKGGGKLRIGILVLVIAALLCAAFFIGSRILQNGQEEPNLEDINGASQGNDAQTGNDPQDQTDAADDGGETNPPEPPVTYDLTGVWVWDSDTALMKETVWNFHQDGTLTIHYFGLGDPENPFDEWPDTYDYDKETSTLTLAGEKIAITWHSETSFTMNSTVLDICDAKKTDESHIPTGAVDIREIKPSEAEGSGSSEEEGNTSDTAETSTYLFKDSDSRYLSKAECEALSAAELRIARNEIYARHGRLFDSEDLQAYFNAQDWYHGTISPAKFDYTVLNDYERYNVNLMKSIEDAKK